jgi:hypothetical protein
LPFERLADIPFGALGVETVLPLTYSEGVAKGRLSLPRRRGAQRRASPQRSACRRAMARSRPAPTPISSLSIRP